MIPLIASSLFTRSTAATRILQARTVYSQALTLAVLLKARTVSSLLAQQSLFYQSSKVTITSLLGSLRTTTILQSQSSRFISYIISNPKRCFYCSSLFPSAIMISLARRARTRAILSTRAFGLLLLRKISAYNTLLIASLSTRPCTTLVRLSICVLIVQMSSILLF